MSAPASLESQEYVTLEVAKERDRQFFSQCANTTEKTQVQFFSQCANTTEKTQVPFFSQCATTSENTQVQFLLTVRHYHREDPGTVLLTVHQPHREDPERYSSWNSVPFHSKYPGTVLTLCHHLNKDRYSFSFFLCHLDLQSETINFFPFFVTVRPFCSP